MNMSAATELDPVLRYAVKLMHSPSSDSAEKIRNALDDLIKQRYGVHKMLANTLSKKFLAEECLAPGSGAAPVQPVSRRPSLKSIDSKASASSSNKDSPVHITTITMDSGIGAGLVITVPDDEEEDDYMLSEEDHMRELEDLMCMVCRRMDVSARNRLIECAECHSLYHQECHKPPISDSDANEQEFSWCCCMCKNKIKTAAVASPAKSSSSHSSSSSSSSVVYLKNSTTKSSDASANAPIPVLNVIPAPSTITTSLPSLSCATSTSSGGGGGSGSSSSGHHHHHKSKSSSSSSSRHHHSKSSSSHSSSGSGRDRERDRDGSSSASSAAVASSSTSSSSTSKSATLTPNINIISADKRLANMKKKAAKMQESRRKHK